MVCDLGELVAYALGHKFSNVAFAACFLHDRASMDAQTPLNHKCVKSCKSMMLMGENLFLINSYYDRCQQHVLIKLIQKQSLSFGKSCALSTQLNQALNPMKLWLAT